MEKEGADYSLEFMHMIRIGLRCYAKRLVETPVGPIHTLAIWIKIKLKKKMADVGGIVWL